MHNIKERVKKYIRFKVKNPNWIEKKIENMNLIEIWLYSKFESNFFKFPILGLFDYYEYKFHNSETFTYTEFLKDLSFSDIEEILSNIPKINSEIINQNLRKFEEVSEDIFEKLENTLNKNTNTKLDYITCEIKKIKSARGKQIQYKFEEIPVELNVYVNWFEDKYYIEGKIFGNEVKLVREMIYDADLEDYTSNITDVNSHLILILIMLALKFKGQITVNMTKIDKRTFIV